MATLDELQKRKVVRRVTMSRVHPHRRELWIYQAVAEWLGNTLPTLKSFYADEQMAPSGQAYALFSTFIRGEELYEEEQFWRMRPIERDIYELKSPDLRFFGWFVRPKVFLIAAVDSFENTHMHNLHDGYRNQVERMRDELDLDEPKVIAGAEPRHVF